MNIHGLMARPYIEDAGQMKMFLEKVKDWFYEVTEIKEKLGFFKITTPFLDLHNDCIELYVLKKSERYLVTDDGYTLNELTLAGFPSDDKVIQNFLDLIWKTLRVDCSFGALYIMVQDDDLSKASAHFCNLVQVIITLNALPSLIPPNTPQNQIASME